MTVRFAPALWIFIAAPFLTCEDPAAFSSVLLVTNTRVVPSSWLLSPPPHAGRALRVGLRGRARARARDTSGFGRSRSFSKAVELLGPGAGCQAAG